MTHEFHAACLWQAGAKLGEGPLWLPSRQRLYFVDIKTCRLLAYDPASGERFSWRFPDYICWIVARRDGDGFMVGMRQSVARVWLEPELRIVPVSDGPVPPPGVRLNDAKTDRHGALWFGTMHDLEPQRPEGRLWRMGPEGAVVPQDEGIHICNGPAFSLDGATMYHADSLAGEVHAYPVDARGVCGRRRLFRRFEVEAEGAPDGMTVDAEGGLWIAQWGGARVCRYLADGTLDMTVHVPVTQPSSCTFGGPGLSTLYITSAREGLPPAALAQQPLAGGLFFVELPLRGGPPAVFG